MSRPLHPISALAAIALLLGVLGACGSDTIVPAEECEPGSALCECRNGTCPGAAGLACVDNLCVYPSCAIGEEGCACTDEGGCSTDSYDRQLRCVDGVCEAPECELGAFACPCAAGGECQTGLVCSESDLCVDPGCDGTGSEGCACNPDRSCDEGLACVLGACTDPGPCTVGSEGCPCNRDNSCDGGLACDLSTDTCEAIGCTPGEVGCACDEGNACTRDDAVCSDGVCEIDDCPTGLEGCECSASGQCGVNDRGEELVCESGLCTAPSCIPGDVGCTCQNGTTCLNGNVCADGFCMPADCVPGTENCECTNGVFCSGNLFCRNGTICVDNTGYTGGLCYDNNTCERGNRCDQGLCVACELGTTGCQCDGAGECAGSLVCDTSGFCASPDTFVAQIPDDPTCYSWCSETLTIGGTSVSCDADGLWQGCLDNQSCVEGSCVLEGEGPRMCASDNDCPLFQACMEGQCYSNCEADDECTAAGYDCHLRVCRKTCQRVTADDSDNCPSGTYCEPLNDSTGVCLPLADVDEDEEPYTRVDAEFTVEQLQVEFSNINTQQFIQISHTSDTAESFRIRKLEHQMFFDDGTGSDEFDADDSTDCDPLVDCPLYWLEMAERGGEATFDSEFEMLVDPGENAEFYLGNAGGSSAITWTGTVEVIHPRYGVQQVTLNYAERPDGQWRGTAFYYSQFNTENLDDWVENPADETQQQRVRNALVQRWSAFRRGTAGVNWDEMQAVFQATQSGQWATTSELSDCTVEACYLYDAAETGVREYSSDLTLAPVPSGVVELPFVMNIRQPNPVTDPEQLVGRIESSDTLHYAGDPALEIRMQDLPSDQSFHIEIAGQRITYLSNFDATIHVGGRYLSDPFDTTCDERVDGNYSLFAVPWLLPDFQRATYLDDETSLLYRYECRDSMLPFDTSDGDVADLAANLSLAQSNPIPDGRTRRRTLSLLDGVIINDSTMVVLFEEQMESFLGAVDTEGISAYGYLVLTKEPVDLEDEDISPNDGIADAFQGQSILDNGRIEPEAILDVECSDAILSELGIESIETANAVTVIETLITGIDLGSGAVTLDSGSNEQVHYFCEDTGLFDGGPENMTAHGIALGTENNNCATNNNGVCEDGGPNADTFADVCDDADDLECFYVRSSCTLGTDFSDCGPRETDDRDVRVRCPEGSRVQFFTVSGMTQVDIANEPCQQDGSCQDTLNDWLRNADPIVQAEAIYSCESGGAYCDLNRYDLRDGKAFFAGGQAGVVFPSFRASVDSAFRYRTRFRSRSGDSVGFTPEICISGSDAIPYCYAPEEIEVLRERVDCLVSIWDSPMYLALESISDGGDARTGEALDRLDDFLAFNFSFEEACIDGSTDCVCARDPFLCETYDGFERLYSELLIMLGDEAYTSSFASRFDLAATRTRSFEGELFEADGINLSGIAGNEMYNLYQAVQYYQEALDRFYELSPVIWTSVNEDLQASADPFGDYRTSFATPEMVTTYFERLLRASTQKSRAYSQISERYLGFNRPDLARTVIERAYTATYLEGVAISRIMQRIRDSFPVSDRPQIDQVLESSQIRYRQAMLDMRIVYQSITDNTQIFGFEPDYIPMPTIFGELEDNAFEKTLQRAIRRADIAQAREETALATERSFDTDAAEFQSELVRIRNTYESQLGELCGTFEGDDGRIYPAIRRYASQALPMAQIGDPCGFAGNGGLYQSMVRVDQVGLQLRQLMVRYSNLFERLELERERVARQCELIDGLASFVLCAEVGADCENVPADAPNFGTNVVSLEDSIRTSRTIQTQSNNTLQLISSLSQLTKCSVIIGTSSGSDCPTALLGMEMIGLAHVANAAVYQLTQDDIDSSERQVSQIRSYVSAYQTRSQCSQMQIDSEIRMREMMLELKELDLEVLRAQYDLQVALADIQRIRNEATRLQLEQDEVEEMRINVEAARNDPNVRIYRNDAIINADFTFNDALQWAYRATRVYEYYTSTTYASRDQLFLIRMVTAGDYNLQNYLIELENSFQDFEETFGSEDLRVQRLSLIDDILMIPLVDEDGVALTGNERKTLLTEALTDSARLDENGYLTIPFSTSTEDLSPLTRNHKIQYIQVDIVASGYGDEIARVYLRQRGTGVVDSVEDDRLFFRFPERTAVIDAFFGGQPYFSESVYRSYRLRDRPYANTAWELVINQRDESVNQDIDLSRIDDVRVDIYYTDFTVF